MRLYSSVCSQVRQIRPQVPLSLLPEEFLRRLRRSDNPFAILPISCIGAALTTLFRKASSIPSSAECSISFLENVFTTILVRFMCPAFPRLTAFVKRTKQRVMNSVPMKKFQSTAFFVYRDQIVFGYLLPIGVVYRACHLLHSACSHAVHSSSQKQEFRDDDENRIQALSLMRSNAADHEPSACGDRDLYGLSK